LYLEFIKSKSSYPEFMGNPTFSACVGTPFCKAETNTSNALYPSCPFDEKIQFVVFEQMEIALE
jgi:hypothetical protein